MNEQFYFKNFHSALLPKLKAEKIISPYEELFNSLNLIRINDDKTEKKIQIYFVISGGCENIAIDYILKNHNFNYPVILITHPSENSLPASLEILAKLKSEGKNGKIIFFNNIKDSLAIDSLKNSLTNVRVLNKLINSNLGLIGAPSDWLIASSQNLNKVRNTWKTNLKEICIEEIKNKLQRTDFQDLGKYISEFKNNANSIVEPFEEEISDSVRIYFILKELVKENKLDAFSLRCFDLVVDNKITGCYALSQLTDDGIIAGCEGDLPSIIGLYWSKLMTGSTPWMANPSSVDLNTSTIKLAHCTVARSITDSYEIRSHFETNLGVGIQGEIKQGDVTLLRLGGDSLEKIWITEGKIKWRGKLENLCRTQVDIVVNKDDALQDLLNNPLGNHIVMIHGHHKKKMLEWHKEFIK